MKIKTLRRIFGSLAAASLFWMVGSVGAMETGDVLFAAGAIRSFLGLGACIMFTFLAGGFRDAFR